MLTVEGVTVSFDGRVVLDRVDLTVADGEIVCVLGPSGCGKSTLLRVIAGLQPVDAGRVCWDGEDLAGVPPHRRRFGLVFQDYQLFPHRDVAGNVGFGLRMAGRPKAEIRRRVAELLELVGLPGFEHRRVDTLSGGEQQRVALARSLAPEPRLLLLDEPLGALDRDLHDRLVGELRTLLKRLGTTAVHVTHDHDEAAAIGDRVVLLGAGPVTVQPVPAAATHGLRRSVLRGGDPAAPVAFDGDDEATTVHLGALDPSGEVVGVTTVLVRPTPLRPGRPAAQLRGMAVRPDRQGTGIGRRLLAGAVEQARAAGAQVVWANARDTALGFYTAAGFTVEGDGFVTPDTGLPHHTVVLDL